MLTRVLKFLPTALTVLVLLVVLTATVRMVRRLSVFGPSPSNELTASLIASVTETSIQLRGNSVRLSSPHSTRKRTSARPVEAYAPPEGSVSVSLDAERRVTRVDVQTAGLCLRPGLVAAVVTPGELGLALDIRFAFVRRATASVGLLYRTDSKKAAVYLGLGCTFYRSTSLVALVTADKQLGLGLRLSF